MSMQDEFMAIGSSTPSLTKKRRLVLDIAVGTGYRMQKNMQVLVLFVIQNIPDSPGTSPLLQAFTVIFMLPSAYLSLKKIFFADLVSFSMPFACGYTPAKGIRDTQTAPGIDLRRF